MNNELNSMWKKLSLLNLSYYTGIWLQRLCKTTKACQNNQSPSQDLNSDLLKTKQDWKVRYEAVLVYRDLTSPGPACTWCKKPQLRRQNSSVSSLLVLRRWSAQLQACGDQMNKLATGLLAPLSYNVFTRRTALCTDSTDHHVAARP